MESEHVLDDVSWQILVELQKNARLSFSELGRRVGLTAPSVAERVRRMEETGVIGGYRVALNFEKIGLPLLAYVRIATHERMNVPFGSVAKDFPEVLECHRITGGDSYIVKVAVASVRHLETLIDRLMPFGETVTAVVLSQILTHRVIHPVDSSKTIEPSASSPPGR